MIEHGIVWQTVCLCQMIVVYKCKVAFKLSLSRYWYGAKSHEDALYRFIVTIFSFPRTLVIIYLEFSALALSIIPKYDTSLHIRCYCLAHLISSIVCR